VYLPSQGSRTEQQEIGPACNSFENARTPRFDLLPPIGAEDLVEGYQ
jgi:hypothetical protein